MGFRKKSSSAVKVNSSFELLLFSSIIISTLYFSGKVIMKVEVKIREYSLSLNIKTFLVILHKLEVYLA